MSYTETAPSNVEFAEYIASEHERLANRKADLINQQRQIGDEIAAIDVEFKAIQAYEAAKTGKRNKSNGATRTRNVRPGSRRNEILELVSVNPTGMSRGRILDALGVKGDKSGEMSISNALTALTKSAALYRENGQYFVSQAA